MLKCGCNKILMHALEFLDTLVEDMDHISAIKLIPP